MREAPDAVRFVVLPVKNALVMGEVGKGITAFKKGVTDGSKEIEDAKVDGARDVTPAPADKDKA